MNLIQQLEKEQFEKLSATKSIPEFGPGDTVIVNVKVVEGERTRIQGYEGVCIGRAGAGVKSWDGRNTAGTPQPDGAYVLRVLYTHAGGRTLLRTFPLVLDRARPQVGNLVVAPNPFEPVPADGDRDNARRSKLAQALGVGPDVLNMRYDAGRLLFDGRTFAGWRGSTPPRSRP